MKWFSIYKHGAKENVLPNRGIRVKPHRKRQLKTNMGHSTSSLASTFSSPLKGEMECTQLLCDIGRIRRCQNFSEWVQRH